MKTVHCDEILTQAVAGHYAVPHFNINGLEFCKGILEICEEMRSPVILGAAMAAAKAMGGYRTIAGFVSGMIEDLGITVPVALHLDHGSYEACLACCNAGFSSVMFDGSKLLFAENIAKTRVLARLCAQKGISLEAEVGTIGGTSAGVTAQGEFADPKECGEMASAGITMLAAGIGNIHGIYPPDWAGLNWNVLAAIKSAVGSLPLVLHGGSNIPEDMLKRAISAGIAKLNVNTDCQIAFMQGTRAYFDENKDRQEKGHLVRKLAAAGVETMKPVVRRYIEISGSAGRA